MASQLPVEVVPREIEPARRDPFVPVEPPSKPAPAPPPQPPSPLPVMQAPPPPAPPHAPQLRYFGSMVAPDGKRVTMLAAGDQAVPVQVGMTLDNGYVVQAISANAVTLTHPPTGTRFDVAIPDPDSKSR